jgi:hypothetical protein
MAAPQTAPIPNAIQLKDAVIAMVDMADVNVAHADAKDMAASSNPHELSLSSLAAVKRTGLENSARHGAGRSMVNGGPGTI